MSDLNRRRTYNQLIITIDFDKTIADTKYPALGDVYEHSKEVVNSWYEQGAYIIINTCRNGKAVYEAEEFLLEQGFHFHKINDQHPNGLLNYGSEERMMHGLQTRKIYSHINIDDTNIQWMLNGHPGWKILDLWIQTIIKENPDHWDITSKLD